ncbi:hypothetical protein TSAR_001286 [Trichomalopsis sarcophagae]|uniref:Major facilitator superfamily associated domain-containing protein n=1 Tax=Trichomalopsis sarcophagae TaxID=543379 RepID=A0A232FCC8_9HYME|nr:hypothetical protein TSAR_001286 [Trichomalopsis sarcophagae]
MQNFGHEEYDYKAETYDNESIPTSRNLPQVPGVRPIVNPEAEGTVDPSLYPQPKEATHKIRGKNDFIEYLFGAVDQELLTVKTFYFFFYSAFGSLFPLMGVYFKQMGMNAGQCGLLIGLRPFIEFFSAPFWGSWADRWQKGKLILLASLSCWIIFTLPLGFIQPPATSCMLYKNHTNYLYIPDADQKIVKRSLDNQLSPEIFITDTKFKTVNNISFNQLHLKENEIPNTSRYIEDNEFNGDNAIHTNIEVKELHENRKLADIPLLDTNLKEKLRNWFADVHSYLENKNLFNVVPASIFNRDETNIQLCSKPEKVLAIKGVRTVYKVIDANEKESVTALFMYSVSGVRAPPMVLYTYKVKGPKKVVDSFPSDWGIRLSESGWMTTEKFYEYFPNVFY